MNPLRRMSLKGRLLLILLSAMVALQVLSFGGAGLRHGFESRSLRNEVIARDIVYAHGQLRGLEPPERALRAAQMRRGGYWFQVVTIADTTPASDHEDFRLILLDVQKWAGTTPLASAIVKAGAADAIRLSLDAQQDVLVHFDQALASTRPPFVGIALYIAAVSALVLWIAWIAVRMATRPLDGFTQAANRLAHDVETAPLPTDGPIEVRDAARAFNAMHVEIRRQLQERSQILAAISHDLKTPLTRLALRLATVESDDQRALMEADVDAMAGLVQEGLDFARSQQLREAKVPVDLNRLVQSIVDQATDLGQDCQMAGHCARPFPAAPRALERVLQNLVDNGLRYGTRVRITLQDHTDAVEIQVHDNGPGLPAELLEKVFEPYFRAESSRSRSTGGTGLGLSIARNLVQAHGGRIDLAPGNGGGLVVRICLPLPGPAQGR